MKFILALAVLLAVAHAALPTTTKVAKVSKIVKKSVVFKKVSIKRSIIKMVEHLLHQKQGPSGNGGNSGTSVQEAEAAICSYGDMSSNGGGSGGGSQSACGALAPMCTTDSQGNCAPDSNYHCQYPKMKALVKTKIEAALSQCTGPKCSKGCRTALLELQGTITAIQNELENAGQDTTADMSNQQSQQAGSNGSKGELPIFLKHMQTRFKAIQNNKKNSYHKGDNKQMEALVCFLEVASETKIDQVGPEFSTKYNATTCNITQAQADAATQKAAKAIQASEKDTGSNDQPATQEPQTGKKGLPTPEPKHTQEDGKTGSNDQPATQEPQTGKKGLPTPEPKHTQEDGKKDVKITEQQQQERKTSQKTITVHPELVQQKKQKAAQQTIKTNKKKVLTANKQTIRAAPASSSAKAPPAAASSAKAAPAASSSATAPIAPLPAAKKPREVIEKDKDVPAEVHKSTACTFTPVNVVFSVIGLYITALFA